VGQVPTGSRWPREIKFDGYRTQIHLREGRAVLYSRNGHDWTSRYKTLAAAVTNLPARHAVLDAEVTVPRADGNCDFWTLQQDVAARRSERLVAWCFDILFLDGRDLRSLPIIERKAILAGLIAEDESGRVLFSQAIECDGSAFYGKLMQAGLRA
jgi:bifunctional non-homologous end joining protein LigD